MVEAQLAALLGFHGMNTRIPITSIATFATTANTQIAYKQFYNDLCQIGITEDTLRQKEDEILEILRSQGMVSSSQVIASDTTEEDQLLEAAYKQFYEELFQIGVPEALIPPKYKVLDVLKSRCKVASGASNTEEKG